MTTNQPAAHEVTYHLDVDPSTSQIESMSTSCICGWTTYFAVETDADAFLAADRVEAAADAHLAYQPVVVPTTAELVALIPSLASQVAR